MKHCSAQRWSSAKILLVLLNVMMTWLTLFTGLKDSPLVSHAISRQNVVRQRLLGGSINTRNAIADQFDLNALASPEQLAAYTIVETPRRDLKTIGEYRSMCTNLNTNSAPLMLNYFDDFWGTGPRRVQIYVSSISAPSCQIMTVKPAWRDQCVAGHGGNETACYAYILDSFDELRQDQLVRLAVEVDLGAIGVPFLRCPGRPLKPFAFTADVLTYNRYWAGGDYHVAIRTSECRGVPLVQSPKLDYVLHQGVNEDDGAEMIILLPPGGWLVVLVQWAQSLVAIVLVVHGLTLALFHSRVVRYLPHGMRAGSTSNRKYLNYLMPFMSSTIQLSDNARAVISFKGTLIAASDVWVTHWLYMWLSVLEAVVDLRATYVKLEMSTQVLAQKFTLMGVVYMCGALIKITWIMCLVQTLLRLFVKLLARCLRSVRLIRSTTREKIEWGIDGISMLVGYRLYYAMLFAIAFTLVLVQGSPTFMVRANAYKVGTFGGVPPMPGFWGSEVACDFVTLLGLLTLVIQLVGGLLLCTKYKYVVDNSMMRFLQKRYVLSGWDGLLAADMLGLDPSDKDFVMDGHGYTKVSIGSLLQLLYLSGPSGFVHLAGDYIFHDNGFSKEPTRFSFPIPKAMEMGLFTTGNGSVLNTSVLLTTLEPAQSQKIAVASSSPPKPKRDPTAASMTTKQSIFERRLRVVSDGYLGKLLLIDATKAGSITVNKETGQRECEVLDALTTMSIMDIKWLMGSEKKIHVQ